MAQLFQDKESEGDELLLKRLLQKVYRIAL